MASDPSPLTIQGEPRAPGGKLSLEGGHFPGVPVGRLLAGASFAGPWRAGDQPILKRESDRGE